MFGVLKLVLLLQIVSLPAQTDTFEVTAGYRSGVRDETGSSGLAAAVSAFLATTPSARGLALAAYSAGGDIEFFSELDRTGFHVKVPLSAKPSVEEFTAKFFSETPQNNADLADHAIAAMKQRAAAADSEFGLRVEDEIRRALLGLQPYAHRPGGWKADMEELSRKDLEEFFAANYGTDRAFVLASGPPGAALSLALPTRSSKPVKAPRNDVFKAERTLRFPPEQPTGRVVLGTPVPPVYYRGWYAVLLLDRLIQRMVPGKPVGTLIPTIDAYYYRLEVPVAAGQFADDVQQNLLHEIERLQYVRATDRDLEESRASAIAFLESPSVESWFLSMGIPERRQEGMDWVRSFSADDMRTTIRDLLLTNRVIASWPPKPKDASVTVESLNSASSTKSAIALDTAPISSQRVSIGDFGALVLLKTLLDRKLIEDNLWNDVELLVDESAGIAIRGAATDRQRVRSWIKDIAMQSPTDEVMAWARDAALHRLGRTLPQIQTMIAQRDPQASFPDLLTVSSAHVQEVAKTYFQ
jgi:hypothetical protein